EAIALRHVEPFDDAGYFDEANGLVYLLVCRAVWPWPEPHRVRRHIHPDLARTDTPCLLIQDSKLPKRRPPSSCIICEWSEHICYFSTYHEIGNIVEVGGLAVENNQLRPRALRPKRKAGRRKDHQRRADHNEKISTSRHCFGPGHLPFRHCLA